MYGREGMCELERGDGGRRRSVYGERGCVRERGGMGEEECVWNVCDGEGGWGEEECVWRERMCELERGGMGGGGGVCMEERGCVS